jgi:hypothetical protein
MNKLSLFYRAISISLVIIFLSNSISYAKVPSNPISASNCGVWKIEKGNLSADGRMWIEPVTTSDDNCTGIFKLISRTGTLIGGGYTLDLRDISINAEIQFSDRSILIPGLDTKIQAKPNNINASAYVRIIGDMTFISYVDDLSLFLVETIFSFIPLPTGCLISHKQIAFIAIEAAPIVTSTAKLAFNGHIGGAWYEFLKIKNLFVDKLDSLIAGLSISCLSDVSSIITMSSPIIPKLSLAFLTWLPVWGFDYVKHKGVSSSITLTYIPPTPPTSTPTLTFIPSLTPSSTPTQQTTLLFQGAPYRIKWTGNCFCSNTVLCLQKIFTVVIQIKSDGNITGAFNYSNSGGIIRGSGYDIPLTGTIDSIVGEKTWDTGPNTTISAKIVEGNLFVGTYTVPGLCGSIFYFSLSLK